ncbi:MAG: glycosyltransferase family 1 protein [Lachnospiraceae bacterium]|nr:glycosyltransferase family 1 protein [Lachnospiraceae bacterium]
MLEPIRVLHVLGATNIGGAESRIMDMYRNIDKKNVQFDFLVHTDKECFFNREIRELGGHIYSVPRFKVYNYVAYKKALEAFFDAHSEFKAVHGHMTSTAAIYLPIAKKAGIPMTIAHARSAGVDKGIKGELTKWLRKPLPDRTDYCFACSRIAGEAVFGESSVKSGKVKVIPNAIETHKFQYDKAIRDEVRSSLGLQDAYVIGHVGRFHYAKNHEFLIEIFAEIKKQKENAVLLLLGDGSLMTDVKEQVKRLGLEKSVIFMGNQTEVAKFYHAMDYLVFPSRFEGMPGTIVEAQAAGLPSLISNTITGEVKVTELVQFAPLQETPKEWADKVCAYKGQERHSRVDELGSAGFDVKTQVKWYERFYTKGLL